MIVYIMIYLFWITSSITESMKWINKYEFENFKIFDYHCLRFLNSLSVFVICYLFLTEININIFSLIGHWILANQVYERIQDKLTRGKFFICADTDFRIFSKSIKIKWIYTIITILSSLSLIGIGFLK